MALEPLSESGDFTHSRRLSHAVKVIIFAHTDR